MDTVRSVLQPVTHNLPPPVRDFAISLLGDTCYQTLVLDIQLDNSDCLKLAVSKGLGIGIIGVSSIVKLPQILKLINSHSASGISFLSYLLETAAYLIGLAYNFRQGFPFSTYGETALIVAQNVVISVLVLQYGGKSAAAGALIAGLGAAGYALFSGGLIDMNMLSYFQAGAGVLGIASKAPQIWTIWQQGGTGQLSAFAVFNYLLGSLSRIFTTLQEVDDKLILYGFIAGFALNAVLAVQMLYYWNAPAAAGKSKKIRAGKRAPETPKGASSSTSSGAIIASARKRTSTRRKG